METKNVKAMMNMETKNVKAMMNGTNLPTLTSVLTAIRNSDTGNMLNFASMISNTITNADGSTLDTVAIQLFTKYWDIEYWEESLDLHERIYLALRQGYPQHEVLDTVRGFILSNDSDLSNIQFYYTDNGIYLTIINQIDPEA